MKALCIYNEQKPLSEKLDNIDYFDINDVGNELREEWADLSDTERLFNNICDKLDSIEKEYDLIFIDKYNEFSDAILLACHIRFHNFTKNKFCFKPIFLLAEIEPKINDKSLLKINNIVGFFQTKGFDFISYEKFIKADKNLNILVAKAKFSFKDDLLNESSTFKIYPEAKDSRHQIANEWGAFRLAKEAGFDISSNLPLTLYFKYLKRKITESSVKEQKTIFEKKINVLLIDDNAHKGWKEALEKVLNANVTSFKSIDELPGNQKYFDELDLIFLDLYLKEDDESDSMEKLCELKEANPAVPVIIFTASNKVKKMKDFINQGADGYFVKESPENALTFNFSRGNFEEFKLTVLACNKKGVILKKYWNGIKSIQKKLINEIEDIETKKTTALFKSRVNERLKMFLGLLKKGFEQTEFEKFNFFYSDYELAFMTLWSVLNEIQEAYYIKRQVGLHRDYPVYNWKIKKQKFDDLLTFEDGEYHSFISKYYKLTDDKPRNHDCSREIGFQIAFLILKKREFDKIDMNIKNHYISELRELKNVRNKLYLTHGDEIKKGFYGKTEQQKRKGNNIEDNIERLFNLVYFLLTSKENNS